MVQTGVAHHGKPWHRQRSLRLRSSSARSCLFGVIILLSCAPQSAVAGKKGDRRRKAPPQPEWIHEFDQEPIQQVDQVEPEMCGNSVSFAEELTSDGFAQKVQKVANGTQSSRPLYHPVVLFHVSWCEDCRRALPAFEEAAEKVFRAAESGQVLNYPVLPKFFSFHCSQEEEAKDICARHAGATYPSIVVFRDKRAIFYNRPRFAATIAWWTMRVTRPAVVKMSLIRHLDPYFDEVMFILFADAEKDAALIMAWAQIALGHLDQYNFAVTQPDSELGLHVIGKRQAPAVDVRAPPEYGLEVIPVQGALGHQTLEAWVSFNQFPPIVELTPWTLDDLRQSGLKVVTFVHLEGSTGTKAFKEFRAWVKRHRRRGRYIFAALNATDVNVHDMVLHIFPLVSPHVAELPRIFIFTGKAYWEDPELVKPGMMNFDTLEALQNSAEAYQDETLRCWFRKEKKLIRRFAARSWKSLFAVIAIPMALITLFHRCCCQVSIEEPSEPSVFELGPPLGDEKAEHVN